MPSYARILVIGLSSVLALITFISLVVNYKEWSDTQECHQMFMSLLIVSGISQNVLWMVFARGSDTNCSWTLGALSILALAGSSSVQAYMIGHGRNSAEHTCDVNQFLYVVAYVNVVILYVSAAVVGLFCVCFMCMRCCDCMEGKEGSC